MSEQNVSFIETLQNVSVKYTPETSTANPAYQEMIDDAQKQGKDLTAFFGQFNSTDNPIPDTWQKFMEAFRVDYLGHSDPKVDNGSLFLAFVGEYRDILGIGNGDISDGDWQPIDNVVTHGDIQQQFITSMDKFLECFTYDSNGNVANPDYFFEKWHENMTVTAVLKNETNPGGIDVVSYEQLFESLFSEGDFQSRVIQFYEDTVAANGYFIPSHAFQQFQSELQEDYAAVLSQNAVASVSEFPKEVTSTLSSAGFKKVLTLDRIFKLLVEMIDVLQRIAAVQAERLKFLTQWQKAYTDSMNQIPAFTEGDGGAFDGEGEDERRIRDDINRVNSTYTEQIRSRRSIIGDDAKALQSNINQSNEAVSQQAQMATAIIQQFSTILNAIYR